MNHTTPLRTLDKKKKASLACRVCAKESGNAHSIFQIFVLENTFVLGIIFVLGKTFVLGNTFVLGDTFVLGNTISVLQ